MHHVVALLLHYRDAELSIRCIRSLLAEPVKRVVVWDNSADDGVSVAAVRAAFPHEPRLDIQPSAENLGFAAGANRGLAHCRSVAPEAWVLLINNDACLLPGALTVLLGALESHAQALLACPDIDHGGRVQGLSYCHRWTGLLSSRPLPGYFAYASGCCLLLALDRLEMPLFDEDFFMYGEDCELGWRLAHRDGALLHVGRTLVEHQGAASSGLGSPFYEAHMVAAHLILARKLAQGRVDALLLYLLRGSMLLARACVRSIRFRSLVPWRALRQGLRIMRGRRR